jgi:uncharacterized cupin superfamily protein
MLASLDRWNTEREARAERVQPVEGSGTLPLDGKEYAIQVGDVIASLSARRHQIINTSKYDLKYLVISNNEPVEVILYPVVRRM